MRDRLKRESRERHFNRAAEKGFSVLDMREKHVKLCCNTCGTVVTRLRSCLNPAHEYNNVPLVCRTCVPPLSGTSNKEREVGEYIKSIVPSTDVIFNDRRVLEGKEIDILIPDLHIGFEFNGLYWHSESVHQGHPHHILHKKQFAYRKGVQLYTIFEDEWNLKPDIVKSRLSHILKQNKTLCYARQCEIKHIDYKSCSEFLNANHIQGKDMSKQRYGAFFDNELVAVMTFKPTSFTKGGDGSVWELSRFAVRNFCNVPGIASKLLNKFMTEFNNPPLISYADARWSIGAVYSSLGFVFSGASKPSYWYIKRANCEMREHRSRHMKHLLLERYPDSDHSKSEWEIMQENGWDRVWDCGTLKYTMNC